MGERAEQFLNEFNQLEKFLKEELGAPANMGFAEVVRRLARQKNSPLDEYENDLLQMAQLRNAIVHEKIAEDFVIAEPNEWAVNRITEIHDAIMTPEKVLPRFKKHVTGFDKNISVTDIFAKIAEKHYSQFPIYDNGKFLGLITIRGIGFFAATESQHGYLDVSHKTAEDLIGISFKKPNYRFCSQDTAINEVEKWFQEIAQLEAVLITRDGNQDGQLLGIIRPRDLTLEN